MSPPSPFLFLLLDRGGSRRHSRADYVALNIPQYPSIVKKPIDLGTIRQKLEGGQYPVPPFPAFEADMRLLFKNCYLFNPPGTPVNEWGQKLEEVFSRKWDERPTGDDDDDSAFSSSFGLGGNES